MGHSHCHLSRARFVSQSKGQWVRARMRSCGVTPCSDSSESANGASDESSEINCDELATCPALCLAEWCLPHGDAGSGCGGRVRLDPRAGG
jgi:hypothetical protein